MRVHLDANFLIDGLEGKPAAVAPVDRWMRDAIPMGISSIAWCEFLCGPVRAPQRDDARRLLGPPLPFLEDDAELAAQLYNLGGRRRGSLADCQIAAVAIRAGAALATANRADFARFAAAGLGLADS